MRDIVVTSRSNKRRKTKAMITLAVLAQVLTIVIAVSCFMVSSWRDDEIDRLTKENEDLLKSSEDLTNEVQTMQLLLNDLKVANMNLHNKLSSMDELINSIEMEHKKLTAEIETEPMVNETFTLKVDEVKPKVTKVPTFNPDDVTELSNLTVEQLKIITPGTRFVGYEEEFLELEKQYNINCIFAMANSIQECGWEDTNSYTAKHNYFGFKGRDPFKSMSHCLDYYFMWINSYYVTDRGLDSVWTIQPVYCPDDVTWDEDIARIGKKLLSKLNVTIE